MTNFPTLLHTSTQEIKYLAFYDLLHARRLKKDKGRGLSVALHRVGLFRLRSTSFEQLLPLVATFCGPSSLEQLLRPFCLEHFLSKITQKTSGYANFLSVFQPKCTLKRKKVMHISINYSKKDNSN